MTFKEIISTITPVDQPKPASSTASLERFPGVPASKCIEMSEKTFLRLLSDFGWQEEDRTGNGAHQKLRFIYGSISRAFSTPHQNQRKRTISKGHISHQTKIFGLEYYDLREMYKREIRFFWYMERCLKTFPEVKTDLEQMLRKTRELILRKPGLLENYLIVSAREKIPLDPALERAALLRRQSAEIKNKSAPVVDSPKVPTIIESNMPVASATISLPFIASPAPPSMPPPVNLFLEQRFADAKAEAKIETKIEPPKSQPDKVNETESDKKAQYLERFNDYLDKNNIKEILSTEEWNTHADRISRGRGIKKIIVEDLLRERFGKPLAKLETRKAPVAQPISVTKEIFVLTKDGKATAYSNKELAELVAKQRKLEMQVITVNIETVEEFFDRVTA